MGGSLSAASKPIVSRKYSFYLILQHHFFSHESTWQSNFCTLGIPSGKREKRPVRALYPPAKKQANRIDDEWPDRSGEADNRGDNSLSESRRKEKRSFGPYRTPSPPVIRAAPHLRVDPLFPPFRTEVLVVEERDVRALAEPVHLSGVELSSPTRVRPPS